MTPVEDMLAGLVEYLKAQSVVADFAADRVFALELPAEEAKNMPRHAVVLEPSGGFAPGYADTLALDAGRIDAYSYGATPYEAMALRRAVRAAFKALEREKVGSVLIHWVRPAGGFMNERDPQARWPRVFESFSVMAAEQAAA